MADYKLGTVEARFADIVWEHAPLPSGELVRLCEAALQWKKPTTYTVLRKLCTRGIFKNENGTVSAVPFHVFYFCVVHRDVGGTSRLAVVGGDARSPAQILFCRRLTFCEKDDVGSRDILGVQPDVR